MRALEAIFDPASRALLSSALDLDGRRVLEIGAGAGSIARWLSERVGSAGHVVALDTNTRFLGDLPEVEVIEGSVTESLHLAPHLEPGGSALSHMMWLSTRALAEKYTETGCADGSDIARYEEFSRSPECWALYYVTGSLVGRRR